MPKLKYCLFPFSYPPSEIAGTHKIILQHKWTKWMYMYLLILFSNIDNTVTVKNIENELFFYILIFERKKYIFPTYLSLGDIV
jgi:hypothetical protein